MVVIQATVNTGQYFDSRSPEKNNYNIVVSTEKIANDLLRERGNHYFSREHLYFASELLSHNLRPLFLPYNDLWRAKANAQPNNDQGGKLLPTVEAWNEPHIRRIPKVVHHVERTASSLRFNSDSTITSGIFGAVLKGGRALHEEEMWLFGRLQENIRREMESGSASFLYEDVFLEMRSEYALSDEEGAYLIKALFEAGSGTTSAAMMSFYLAMVLHPEWQAEGWK
ncbi:hypothetical protein RUND412_005083 [Rhizina undulata]